MSIENPPFIKERAFTEQTSSAVKAAIAKARNRPAHLQREDFAFHIVNNLDPRDISKEDAQIIDWIILNPIIDTAKVLSERFESDEDRDQAREKALDEIVEISQELGLYDL